ncbi:toprim domain-containing protein [Ureibacillus composti]
MTVEKCIIVEGRSDKLKIEPIFAENVTILCTNGTISEDDLLDLLEPFEQHELYTLFDADNSGEKLRKLTRRTYSEAVHLLIPRTYIEVANAPSKVLAHILNEARFVVHKQYLTLPE